MKSYIFIFLLALFSCSNSEERNYASINIVRSNIDVQDLDKMIHSAETLKENQFNRIIHLKEMKKLESFVLKKTKEKIIVLHYDKRPSEYIISYLNSDSIPLLAYLSGIKLHDSKVFILKNENYKAELKELITDENFVLNKLSSPAPKFDDVVKY